MRVLFLRNVKIVICKQLTVMAQWRRWRSASEVIAIYPITPSSAMAEQADARAGNGLKMSGAIRRV